MTTISDPAPRPSRLEALAQWAHRHRFALALASFAAGLASFVLIHRQVWVAKWVSALLLLSWLVMLLEKPLSRGRLPPLVLRFLIQAIHQETFFFALPFFYATTTWTTPQAGFTVALTLVALASMWDPLYYRAIAARRWMYLVFHAVAIFVTMLVALPIIGHLTTAQSLAIAAAAMPLLILPGLAHAMGREQVRQRLFLMLVATGLGALAWWARPWIPPATLWVEDAAITDAVNPATRKPDLSLASASAAHLHAQGLYAWTAIHAPRGLREGIYHRWRHEGRVVDRIALSIVGGRAQGYRAWSYKKGFPADPTGHWEVEVLTEGGQLIGRIGFEVIGDAPAFAPAPAPAAPEPDPVAEPPEPMPPEPASPEPAAEAVSPAPSAPESSSP